MFTVAQNIICCTFQLCAIHPVPMEEHVFLLGHVPVSQDGQGPHVINVSCVCTIYNATYDWLHVKSFYTHQYFVIAMLQVTSCKQVLTTARSHHLYTVYIYQTVVIFYVRKGYKGRFLAAYNCRGYRLIDT